MVTAILLSAGSSERFGSPKALAKFSDCNVIQYVQNTLLQSACDKIIVVLGAHGHQIMPSIFIHSRIRVVYNKDHNLGQTSSMLEGWRHAEEASQGVLFLPVDCPLVMPSTINTIIDEFKKSSPQILVPAFKSQKGHPPLFHQRLKPNALQLAVDQGLNSLFEKFPPKTLEIDDPGIVTSFNTPEEFNAIKVSVISKR